MKTNKILQDTPIKKYQLSAGEVFVKREDLACPPPGPPFAKVRGLLPTLTRLKQEGIQTVGYMETTVSMAGWGISYFCKKLDGLKAVIFVPKYTAPKDNQSYQFKKWKQFGAEIEWIDKPTRMQINFYKARKILTKYPNSAMLPLGLSFVETTHEVAKQVALFNRKYESIVINIGSGTMAAGLLLGLSNLKMDSIVYGIFCAPKDILKMHKKIFAAAKLSNAPSSGGFNLLKKETVRLNLIDAGYEYTQKEEVECPFPCNPYYDRKAWAWLLKNYDNLKKPILFWNIGSDYNLQKEN
ncbi:MAG: PLP-dependent lyase/thiolase [Gammaproteobacteria bacterium]|nr:PLP-dependent lyase/thiolase [Gammaproteobacteria bacterium]